MRRRLALAGLVFSVGIGVWLLAAPGVLGLAGGARLSHLIAGPVAASLAVISLSGATRLAARANVAIGAWLVAAPVFLDHGPWWFESVLSGMALAALALLPTGEGRRFGGGWRALVADRVARFPSQR